MQKTNTPPPQQQTNKQKTKQNNKNRVVLTIPILRTLKQQKQKATTTKNKQTNKTPQSQPQTNNASAHTHTNTNKQTNNKTELCLSAARTSRWNGASAGQRTLDHNSSTETGSRGKGMSAVQLYHCQAWTTAVLGRARFASYTGQIHHTACSTAHVRLYQAVSCILGLSRRFCCCTLVPLLGSLANSVRENSNGKHRIAQKHLV